MSYCTRRADVLTSYGWRRLTPWGSRTYFEHGVLASLEMGDDANRFTNYIAADNFDRVKWSCTVRTLSQMEFCKRPQEASA